MRALPLALLLFSFSSCAPDPRAGEARQPLASPPSIFRLFAAEPWSLPSDVPDELLTIPDPFRRKGTLSIAAGAVIGAWTTAPTATGDVAAIVWECERKPTPNDLALDGGSIDTRPDASAEYAWRARAEAGLVPLGIDLAAVPDLLPFAAAHRHAARAGVYAIAPAGPAWIIEGAIGAGAARANLITALIGEEDARADSPNDGGAPLMRYRRVAGARSAALPIATVDRAAYVLRLNTQGGVGPDEEGASCEAGTDPVRAEMSADFYFVTLPWPASEWPLVAGAE